MEKTKILLVENESTVAQDIKNMLLILGYDVPRVLNTGQEAVAITRKIRPDLVLMNVMVKGEVDGIEAAHRIYKDFDIPVVYITDYVDRKRMERVKKTEPFGFIIKPFEERELQTSIEIALYKYQMDVQQREREQWLTTVLKSIGDAVIVTDDKDKITFMNPLAEKLTGWKQTDTLNKPVKNIFRIISKNSGKARRITFKEVAERKTPSPSSNLYLISKNGKKTPIDYRMHSISNNKHSTSGFVLTFTDIRHRIMTEKELKLRRKKLQEALEATVQAIALTIETRDPFTAGHQRRVTRLACAIAEEMELPENKIEGLRMAGDLHDIGKISVPAEILNKPGPISEVEYKIIKTHPQVGYDILKNIEFPWPIAQIVHQHHERMDGSGYPLGLRRGKILLEARILAVADVVEAMTTHRPYHPAQPIEMAMDEISKNKGKLYDLQVVEVCIRLFKKKGFKFSS